MKNKNIQFLTLAEIIVIHQNQIELYGGDAGIRDLHLLTSALALPESTFDKEFLHKDLYEMAAAYTFHICQNHPFIDGNKRTGLVAGLIFLEFNGVHIEDPEGLLYEAIMNIELREQYEEIRYLSNPRELICFCQSAVYFWISIGPWADRICLRVCAPFF